MPNVRTMSSCRRSGRSLEQISNPQTVLYSQVLVRYPTIPKAMITEPSVADALFFNISGDNNAALGRSAGVSTQFAVAASPSGDRIEMGKSAHERPWIVSKSSRVPAPFERLNKLAKFLRNSSDRKPSIPSTLITIALVCFGLLPNRQAISPPRMEATLEATQRRDRMRSSDLRAAPTTLQLVCFRWKV